MMTITRQGNKVYFVYRSLVEAGEACERMNHLKPHIVSRGGHMNAVVVDMEKMPTLGEMQ